MTQPGDPEKGGGVEDVGADHNSGGEWEGEEHGEREERRATDGREAHDEAAYCSDRDRNDLVAFAQSPQRRHRPDRVHEGLGEERERADQQGGAEHLALHGVDAVAVPVRQVGGDPDADQGQGRASEQHPAAQARSHRAEAAVTDGAERLEDGPVQDVGADRHGRVEVEEEDEDRRHERAATHSRHPDENADDEACKGEPWVVHRGQ